MRLVELSRVPTPGHAVTHVVFVRDDEGQGRLITADYADGYVCVHPVTESGVILEVAQMLRGEGHGPLPKPDQAASLAFVPWNALQGERGCRGSQRGHGWVGVCGAAWFRTHRDVVVGWQAAYPA